MTGWGASSTSTGPPRRHLRVADRGSARGRGTRPGYKCHPHADPGTTRRMIEVLRFVVGLAADVVRRRAGSRRRERPASAAAHRRATKDRGAGPVGTVAALHDGARSTPGAGVARRHVARPAGDHPPLAPGRLSRVLAPTLSAVGSTPYRACGAYPRDGHQQSALGRGASPRRAAQARHPRLQENRPAIHASREAPRRRAMLVDLPAESRRVGVRLRADLRRPVPRGLRALRPRAWATHDRPRRSDVRAERRVVCAASPERRPGGCAGGFRLRP